MDLKETANTLRAQAKHLQFEAQKLLDAATILDGVTNGAKPPTRTTPLSTRHKENSKSSSGRKRKPPSLDTSPTLRMLGGYLKKHGPSFRREIHKGTNINEGTVSFLLNFKEYFSRDESGRWSLKNPNLFVEGESEGRIMT